MTRTAAAKGKGKSLLKGETGLGQKESSPGAQALPGLVVVVVVVVVVGCWAVVDMHACMTCMHVAVVE